MAALESSKNFDSTPSIHKIRSQTNCIIRRPIIRSQIVFITRSNGHIGWIGGPKEWFGVPTLEQWREYDHHIIKWRLYVPKKEIDNL